MKIYVNRKPVSGPWGGGNKSLTTLCEKLSLSGHNVVYDLNHQDIDIIFCFDPRPNDHGEWYQNFYDYRNTRPDTKIIQRVGDVGTHGKPELTELVKASVECSDYMIFPSEWAKEKIDYNKSNFDIVYNAPLETFHKHKNTIRYGKILNKIRIVTHHWSTNPKKGFDYYSYLDKFIEKNNRYEFTYIGRLPGNFALKNSKHIKALDSNSLSLELPKYDLYLTASVEEAGANHVIEAMACGLPIVYHKDGGSIVNYCSEYGLEYQCTETMIEMVDKIALNYRMYKDNVLEYNNTINTVIEKYINIICNIK